MIFLFYLFSTFLYHILHISYTYTSTFNVTLSIYMEYYKVDQTPCYMYPTPSHGYSHHFLLSSSIFSLLSLKHQTMKIPILFFLLILIVLTYSVDESTAEILPPQELLKGFTATPNPTVKNSFQPILTDSTGNYSLSFLRVDSDQLALAIVHVPSGVPLWRAEPGRLAQWGKDTQLIFNGSLVIMDSKSGVIWSTHTDGDRVVLSTSGGTGGAPNLQIQHGKRPLWQSFDFPSDTLLENQNFTSAMRLVSSNGLYTMRLGSDFIGLYAKFNSAASSSGSGQIYYQHRGLQAKADIVEGKGPILVRISSDGFLGMYQTGSVPADVQSFNSYQRSVPGPRRMRIEDDGNLKGYYWSGSDWILDYQAISEPCELPNPCGPYGLCRPGEGCSCLNNQTHAQTGQCHQTRTEPENLCGVKPGKYSTLNRTGVELPFKELMGSTTTASYEECEKSCELNCTCWGALYNNASGFCYTVDYPIQTILGVGDETKMGYFKVLEGAEKKKKKVMGLGVGIGVLCGAILVLLGVVCFGGYKLWKRNKRVNNNRYLEEDNIVCPGPYKDLGSESFGSIQLSNR